MFVVLGNFVTRRWYWVIAAWLVLLVVTQKVTPRWNEVTYDGDLAYMPSVMSSVRAERVLDQAFPRRRSKSEMLVVFSRTSEELRQADRKSIDRFAARLQNLLGVSKFLESQRRLAEATQLRDDGQDGMAEHAFLQAEEAQRQAISAWDESLRLDEEYAETLNNLAFFKKYLGKLEEAERDERLAVDFSPSLTHAGDQLLPSQLGEIPVLDVWTRHTDVVGSRLRSRDRQAELVVVRLAQEFMATDNIRILSHLEEVIRDYRLEIGFPTGLNVDVTGSAAVGGDMLRSAKQSIKNTELYTVLFVVGILAIVYQSPLLVAVPLVTIVVSITVATGWLAALTQLHHIDGMDWWNFKVFTTTRIFVIVILYGAGTDFCLFLIARYREELGHGTPPDRAVAKALTGVGSALTASALTTIVGLSMMFFAEFGKFRNSGPAIGFCLAITLLACLTLAPALLRAFGTAVFWPRGIKSLTSNFSSIEPTGMNAFWDRVAQTIIAYPGQLLVVCTVALSPFAVMGTRVEVTYDFLSELGASTSSKIGAEHLAAHFPIGDTAPLVVLAYVPGRDLDEAAGKSAIADLTRTLYVEGVTSVRSLAEPRGGQPTGFSLKKAALQSHQLTRSLYLSKQARIAPTHEPGDVARFEVLLAADPFSRDSIDVLNEIGARLSEHVRNVESYWFGADFSYAGTTAGIRDLRAVTRSDNVRIQVLVVLAVLAVLLVLVRRPIVCLYLIVSVLFSYYVTLGVTEWFFQWTYGETFRGLDWKVPLFLFVILVAIGQDYNIYLSTRIFEEQATHGMLRGLRRAIVRTGGIITSCGVIMAGTFVSMTAGSLRGIVELGFALSLGVLIDTFVVRPVLVPSFLALLFRSFPVCDDETSAPPIQRPDLLERPF